MIAAVAAVALGGGPAVRDSVNDYTWEELSAISQEISKAGDEGAAIEVAKKYHLATADGRLDGTQVKNIELTDGTKAQVQIVGFAHDERADGSGKAGITFMFTNAIAERPMNATDTTHGGWEKSQMREWLAIEGMNKLPADLSAKVVEVKKFTNNAGLTKDTSAVTPTSDRLWLPSAVELGGTIAEQEWSRVGGELAASIYNHEGFEYQLFLDSGVNPFADNIILARTLDNTSCSWWERTPTPGVAEFRTVSKQGAPHGRTLPAQLLGVIPGFCI